MKKEQKNNSDNETLFRLDCRMALHQRLCWLILALLAVGVMALLVNVRFLPEKAETSVLFVLMLLFLLLYRWMSDAPYRSMVKWRQRLERGNPETHRRMLDYVQKLEKALPDAERRQLNYYITGIKAILLSAVNRKEEALSLLRRFDQFWDESQRIVFQALIEMISVHYSKIEQKEN